jgi:protein required for attachment to host cells
MATTWIIAADASRAKVLQVTDPEQKLLQIDEMLNPEGRAHERDLQTDAEPRFNGRTGGPASDREAKGATEHSTEVFARELGRYLDKARIAHRYDKLFLVAPPKFLGLIRKEIGKEVEKLVSDDIDKDLSWLDARDIDRLLKAGATEAKD